MFFFLFFIQNFVSSEMSKNVNILQSYREQALQKNISKINSKNPNFLCNKLWKFVDKNKIDANWVDPILKIE